jgi:hypothetical protein
MRALKYGNKKKAEKELGRAQGHTRKTEYYTGRASGGKSEHPDEAQDKALIRKMVKAKDLKMKDGGAAKRKKYEDGGGLPSPYEAMESSKRLGEIRTENRPEPSESEAARTYNREGANAVHDMEARKKGGRTKKATGGAFSDYMGEDSSSHKSGGKSGKGNARTNVTVILNPGDQQRQQPAMNPMQDIALAKLLGGAGGPPQQLPPPAPGGMTPPVMPQGASPMAPPGGATPPGGMMPPRQFASGGRAQEVQVPYKKPGRKGEYPAMDFGSGGGYGRKQKIDAYGDQQKK